MRVGDIVSMKKHGIDMFYKIDKMVNGMLFLKGLFHRTSLITSAENSKLSIVRESQALSFQDEVIKNNQDKIKKILAERVSMLPQKVSFKKPKLLHIDSDEDYMKVCVKFYEVMGIEAYGYVFDEPNQPKEVRRLLEKHKPDILVVTGHDIDRDDNNIDEITDYENSKYYVESTSVARGYESSMDSLIIIAGACQSDYERIMKAGSNFASSPARIMIDVLDPCYVAERVAYTYFTKTVTPEEAVKYTTTKMRGIGGVESSGVLRVVEPEYRFKEIK